MLTDPTFNASPSADPTLPAEPTNGTCLIACLDRERGFSVRAGARAAQDGRVAVCRGAPIFTDGRTAAIAQSHGAAAAWLSLYSTHGPRAPEHVLGSFAVVIADEARRSAFAAVDRFAIESLCYSASDRGIAFADRADSVPGATSEVEPQAIFDYLWFHVIPAPRTVFRGVLRLQPGHALSYERAAVSVSRYWEPRFEETRSAPLPQLCERFNHLLRDAVTRVADTPRVGCYLSGGTDSSTVAGMVGLVTGKPARAYTIGFDVAGYDEMAYARIAAKHFGLDHHEYYLTPADVVDNMPRFAAHVDQPFGNSSALPAYCCARLAREDGVTRMLAGDGGDELFGGNVRYAKQRAFELYALVPSLLRHTLLEPLLSRRFASRLPLVRKAASYVEQARVPMPDRLEMYNLVVRTGVDSMFEPDFLATIDAQGPLAQQRLAFGEVRAGALINRMLAYDWKYTLADNDLRKVVESAKLAGMGVAFPLLDERLVDFSLGLPPELKMKGFELRWFFKHALRDFLPREILKKKKHGFGMPFGAWALADARLRELVFDALGTLKTRGIVRADFIEEVVDRRLVQHPGYYGELVWILAMLELWLRRR